MWYCALRIPPPAPLYTRLLTHIKKCKNNTILLSLCLLTVQTHYPVIITTRHSTHTHTQTHASLNTHVSLNTHTRFTQHTNTHASLNTHTVTHTLHSTHTLATDNSLRPIRCTASVCFFFSFHSTIPYTPSLPYFPFVLADPPLYHLLPRSSFFFFHFSTAHIANPPFHLFFSSCVWSFLSITFSLILQGLPGPG